MSRLSSHAKAILQSRSRLMVILPLVIPLMLLPLAAGWAWHALQPASFIAHRDATMLAYLIYVVLVRFALLDLMLFRVSRRRHTLHLDLLHIVFAYLEVTAVTLLFFALLYEQFGIFDLFRYNGTDAVRHMLAMRPHSFRVALYISMELFTTLGLGDWIPRTLNAMLAAGIEALLGFVQAGVFFAVLIYAHQDKDGT